MGDEKRSGIVRIIDVKSKSLGKQASFKMLPGETTSEKLSFIYSYVISVSRY